MTENIEKTTKQNNNESIDNVSDVDIEDVLSIDGDEFVSIDNEVGDAKAIKNINDNEIDYLSNTLPSFRGNDCPLQFKELVDRILVQYKLLPSLDYNEIYQEISELSIKSCPTPTLQVLNDEIQRVQAAKDRLSEIYVSVVQSHNFKKRAVDILQDAWGKFTDEKNAEKRKGDSAFRLSNFVIDFAKIETLLKACNHILKNLDSLHDSLSRRITIYQLTLKLQDIGRGALPDLDLEKGGNIGIETIESTYDSNRSNNSDQSELVESVKSVELKEESF